MTEPNSDTEGVAVHPEFVPDENGHVWGPWMPKDRASKYRVCLHPKCTASQVTETKA